MSKATEDYPAANSKVKDQLFRLLFREKADRLELYNAVNHSSYTNLEDLETEELEGAIYMTMKNDVSFVFQSQPNLYEHQSTLNPNMPLRCLFYVSDLLQRRFMGPEIYRSQRMKIPEPKFIVFYNGADPYPERGEYRLSEMFETASEDPQLDLRVQVININPKMNPDIVNASDKLYGYAFFTGSVRSLLKAGDDLTTAVDGAIDECIEKDILRDFFRKHRAEVKHVSLYEFDEEAYLKMERADAKEEGLKEGLEKGLEKGRKEGLEENRILTARLMEALIKDGKSEAFHDAILDGALFERLLEDYHITI